MGTSLTGLTPATTYDALIKVGDNSSIDGTLKTLSDGLGNDLPLQMSSTDILVNSTFLYFNGTTSSFPSIKRNASALNFRLADDSAFCGINTGNINVTGFVLISANLEIGGSSYMGFGNRSLFRSPSDGVLTLLNYDSNDFSRLQFGGTTSSFPSIKRNGTQIDFRLADDSGFCQINANKIGIGPSVTLTENTGTAGWNTTLGNVTGNVGSIPVFGFNNISDSSTSGTSNYVRVNKSITPSTGSADFNNFIVDYDITASGSQTGTATGILLNATETNLNGITHNLMDFKVGGSSKFKVNNVGAISIGNTVASAVAVASTHKVTVVIGGTTYYLLASNV